MELQLQCALRHLYEMASVMHAQEARLGWRYCIWMEAAAGVETAGTTSHKVTLVNLHRVVMWRVWW